MAKATAPVSDLQALLKRDGQPKPISKPLSASLRAAYDAYVTLKKAQVTNEASAFFFVPLWAYL